MQKAKVEALGKKREVDEVLLLSKTYIDYVHFMYFAFSISTVVAVKATFRRSSALSGGAKKAACGKTLSRILCLFQWDDDAFIILIYYINSNKFCFHY